MKANKDGGTSVGFSKVGFPETKTMSKEETEAFIQNHFTGKILNKECEHEWIENIYSENLSEINKQEWEEILEQYKIEQNFYLSSLSDWLKENYLPPQKKNT